jgi:hypothetical protein
MRTNSLGAVFQLDSQSSSRSLLCGTAGQGVTFVRARGTCFGSNERGTAEELNFRLTLGGACARGTVTGSVSTLRFQPPGRARLDSPPAALRRARSLLVTAGPRTAADSGSSVAAA